MLLASCRVPDLDVENRPFPCISGYRFINTRNPFVSGAVAASASSGSPDGSGGSSSASTAVGGGASAASSSASSGGSGGGGGAGAAGDCASIFSDEFDTDTGQWASYGGKWAVANGWLT